MLRFVGYASSSVVDTIGTRSFRISSICGSTFFNDELVHSTTTSGLAVLIVFFTSPDTLILSARPTLAISPRSRPAFAGSMSAAPTMRKPLRSATCRTTPAPIREPAGRGAAIAAKRQLCDHRAARSEEPHDLGRRDSHLAQHLERHGDDAQVPPLLQRVAQYGVDLHARAPPDQPPLFRRSCAVGLELDRRHQH